MVKIYKQPFAHDGDAIAIPDASQPDGKMSSADGWTPDYQLPKTDPNYKPVGRQEMNGVFKEVTEALGQVQVQGAASWSADGAPYPVNAQVYHDGNQWLALRANSVEPAEGADWSAVMPRKTVTDAINNSSIGVGQTWQNVIGQRSSGTVYTNTTGRTIAVSAQGNRVGSGGGNIMMSVNSNLVMGFDSGNIGGLSQYPSYSVFGIIPPGDTYSISGTSGLLTWLELRA